MRVAAVTVALGGLALCAAAFTQAPFDSLNVSDRWCPQPEYVPPSPAMAYYDTPLFANLSLERLFGAIAHATVAYDDFGEPEPEDMADRDPRWDTFPPFHNFLRETYPLVHKHAKLQVVGGYSLLFTLEGTSDAKPLMLAAHLDVVAASTALDRWKYPPFEGHYDGEWIWGRGSSDCKSNLLGQLSALEHLLEGGFKPRRTLLLAYGQDEEARGKYGATRIALLLQERYGIHGVDAIFDEGGMGLDSKYGPLMALPALAEKGYADVTIRVESFGGHSSVPGPHTSIGYLARFISALEDADIYSPALTKTNPYYGYLHCLDLYGSRNVPRWLHSALEKDDVDDIAAQVADLGVRSRFILQTSKAATVVHGGVKNNALPEEAGVVFNSRIETTMSVRDHTDRVAETLIPVARRYDLSMNSFGDELCNGTQGTVYLELLGNTEPSPITPWHTPQFQLYASAVKSAFGDNTIVAPSLSVANTDTKHYWNVSTNIIRWTPARLGTRLGAHTVNERIKLTSHIETVKFFHELIIQFEAAA